MVNPAPFNLSRTKAWVAGVLAWGFTKTKAELGKEEGAHTPAMAGSQVSAALAKTAPMLLVMLVKLGDMVEFHFGPAILAFVLCVAMSMIASICFDPHAIWEESNDE